MVSFLWSECGWGNLAELLNPEICSPSDSEPGVEMCDACMLALGKPHVPSLALREVGTP